MTSIIEVANLSKQFKISHINRDYLSLRDRLHDLICRPFKNGVGLKQEVFWALQGINFSIEPGDVLGVIGKNGAGKSTLLKILARVTPPTSGRVKIKGKIAALLGVGTGFHPELSGRENIYFNGAVLGMAKKEIDKRFDSIVEFSGVAKFLDMPVKHYSSGMTVRLAFAVAAHIETDILLIDEVLAVGDAEFQKKCLGKMDEVVKQEGRTVVFVSHDMRAIKSICQRLIILDNGQITYSGKIDERALIGF